MSENSYQGVNVGAIIACTARENTRYAVHGAEVRRHPTKEGVFISATNGRVLAVIHDDASTAANVAKPSIIPGEILPTTKTGKRDTRCLLNGDWHAIDSTGKKPTTKAPEQEGAFPPCSHLMPELRPNDGRVCIELNIDLLKQVADAIGEDLGEGPILTLWIGGRDRPVVCVGRFGTMGVVMPTSRDADQTASNGRRCANEYEVTRKAYVQACKA